jgi:hypothetical protein
MIIPHSRIVMGEASSIVRGLTQRRNMLQSSRSTLKRRRSWPGCRRRIRMSIWLWRSPSHGRDGRKNLSIAWWITSWRLSARK